MKHGISPTSDHKAFRDRAKFRMVHVSVPLGLQIAVNEMNEDGTPKLTEDGKNVIRVEVVSVDKVPPGASVLRMVRAPVKGMPYVTLERTLRRILRSRPALRKGSSAWFRRAMQSMDDRGIRDCDASV